MTMPYHFSCVGDLILHQAGGTEIKLNLFQPFPDDPKYTTWGPLWGSAYSGNHSSEDVSGYTHDNDFFLYIPWKHGPVGEYHGIFTQVPDGAWSFIGRLSGRTFNRKQPKDQATWFSDRDFRVAK